MGNLPCPMPADYKHKHSHLMLAIRHGKDVAWIEEETAKLRNWAESKGVLRLSWDRSLSKWLEKAILFELQQEAGRKTYGLHMAGDSGVHRGGSGVSNGVGAVGELAREVAAVNRWFDRPYRSDFVEHMIRVTMSPSSLRQALKSGGLSPEAERVVRAVLGEGDS
jgi:hypothetical protein